MEPLLAAPSAHALSLAGADLPGCAPPVVRVEAAREVVVVLPRSRDPHREVFLDRCREDRVPVVLRPSGGGAVVLSPGVVAASALLAVPAGVVFPEPIFRALGALVAGALETLGVGTVGTRGVSDLCVGDRKVAGSSLRLWRARALYQVSVLVEPDLNLMDRYLRHPSREPAYRAGRCHRDFVAPLCDLAPGISPPLVADTLAAALAAAANGALHGLAPSV